jgi:microcystin degradation protein MlrC
MKMFFAMLSTETNTFSPMPTGQDNFKVTRGIDLDNAPQKRWGHCCSSRRQRNNMIGQWR